MISTFKTTINLMLVLAISMLGGCQPDAASGLSKHLAVQLSGLQRQPDCQQPIFIAEQPWQIQNLRFFLSDFSLNQRPLQLASSQWQQPRLALLGTDCQGNSNWLLEFTEPLTPGRLSFTLGLPFPVNHQNPLTASSPLNHSEMYWSWQLGYKFLRLDLQGPGHGWAFHLGSTGCQSASVLRPPAAPCKAANTFKVTLDYQRGQSLQLDLALLLDKVDLGLNSSCMSDSQQSNCQQLFDNLMRTPVWQMTPDEQRQHASD